MIYDLCTIAESTVLWQTPPNNKAYIVFKRYKLEAKKVGRPSVRNGKRTYVTNVGVV